MIYDFKFMIYPKIKIYYKNLQFIVLKMSQRKI